MIRKILLRRAAQREFDEAAVWYDRQRRGLGLEFRDAVDVALSKAAAFTSRNFRTAFSILPIQRR
jgi:hypothetical protein